MNRQPKYKDTFVFIKKKIERKEKIDKAIAIDFMQSEVHNILNSFLNGGYSYKGFLLYPLIKDVSDENKRRLSNIIYILKHFDEKFSEITEFHDSISMSSYNFASLLCQIYNKFEFKGKTIKILEKRAVNVFKLSNYQADTIFLKPIENLKDRIKTIKEHILGFYIHGSIATKDYEKGWSDVDTLLILKKDAFKEPENLLKIRDILYKLRSDFYKIDPLQHHGSIIITEFDLSYYPEFFLPLDALNCSKSLIEYDKNIRFKIRNSKIESMRKFYWVANYLRILSHDKLKSSYDLKFALHLITLFPALYLEAKGIYVYKKYSFDIARKDFTSGEWKPIKYVEDLRKEWTISRRMPFFDYASSINPLLACMVNSKYIDYSGGIKDIDYSLIIRGMKKLSESALKKLGLD